MTDSLNALSPLDGRYARATEPLRALFSEAALIRYRVKVETAWLLALAGEPAIAEIPPLDGACRRLLSALGDTFDDAAARRVKQIEATTNHDVKAVEYWLREQIEALPELAHLSPFIHFACTSEDINNLAYGLMVRDSRDQVMLPALGEIRSVLRDLVQRLAGQPMLSRTHGQTATPTTLGKELANVVARLDRQMDQIGAVAVAGKCNGAVGNFNAHLVAYPEVNWLALSESLVLELGLAYQPLTTQIEPHDYLAELSHALMRANTVLLDLSRDIWGYISLGYFRQRLVEGEVGSSTMPHKVNPIDFENAEGNLGLANALLAHLAEKLPVSRWQRDLSDSTVQRSIGSAFGYCLIAYRALLKGLGKLEAAPERLAEDLDGAWEVLTEAIQTVMRRHGLPNPYEQLKAFSRGRAPDRSAIRAFIQALDLPVADKQRLLELTPAGYTGAASDLACRLD